MSRIGKLDFAFVAAFLLPLLSILLLHDLKASEVRNNRWTFLSATSGNGPRILKSRALLRSALLFVCVMIPFVFVTILSAASLKSVLAVLIVVAVNLAFWSLLSLFVTARIEAGPTAAALLLGVWFVLAVALPVGGKLIVENAVPVPKGGEILLSQREAVNDAWDLPKEATLTLFYERHPEWANSEPASNGFDWYWYYAFQQVGDQTVEAMSQDLREGVATRDRAMGLISFVSPPLLVDRTLASAARTDIASFQAYDRCVRNFHASLRDFHYGMLFGNKKYSARIWRIFRFLFRVRHESARTEVLIEFARRVASNGNRRNDKKYSESGSDFLFSLVVAHCMSAQAIASGFTKNKPIGERTDLRVEIPAGENDPGTFIPVSIIKGASPGPAVLMVAGVHGYEFSPILAAKRLADEIDPETLSGDLIIVRAAHVPAFEARSPYVNPNDRKNLNRSFPGRADGTQTERIAWALSSEIIPAADFVLDVHSGDGAEWLEAFVGAYGGPLATDYPTAFKVAEAFGFPNVVRYKMNTQEQIDRGRSLNRQAVAQGLPTVLVEIGENGSRDAAHVAAIVDGVKNVLRVLGMVDEAPVEQPRSQRYFEGTSSTPVEHAGVWFPIETGGRRVVEGETLGVIRNFHGRVVETVKAKATGYALYGLAGPPVRAGESVATIGALATRDDLLPK